MSCCNSSDSNCSSESKKIHINICPNCQKPGAKVKQVTLKAMLSVSLKEIREEEYFFCSQRECEIVYFSNSQDGDGKTNTFNKQNLRVQVFQKEELGETPVCYCFKHTFNSIQGEIKGNESEGVYDEISDLLKKGKCACEIRNPQGSCCLGNVKKVVKLIGNVKPIE